MLTPLPLTPGAATTFSYFSLHAVCGTYSMMNAMVIDWTFRSPPREVSNLGEEEEGEEVLTAYASRGGGGGGPHCHPPYPYPPSVLGEGEGEEVLPPYSNLL